MPATFYLAYSLTPQRFLSPRWVLIPGLISAFLASSSKKIPSALSKTGLPDGVVLICPGAEKTGHTPSGYRRFAALWRSLWAAPGED